MIHLVIRKGLHMGQPNVWSKDYQVMSAHVSKPDAEKRAAGRDTQYYRFEVLSKRALPEALADDA